MGIFDFFKRKPEPQPAQEVTSASDNEDDCSPLELAALNEPPIPDSAKQYYYPDEYYTDFSYPGTFMQRRVVPFSERAKKSYPSKSGLYVAEILLLQYCSYGTYPHPRNGYPGFWWFGYGIRNVDFYLDSLAKRGYIEFRSAAETLPSMTVAQLKEFAASHGIIVKGKKADIISTITANISVADLEAGIVERKYCLTPKGEKELSENAYVPLMHKAPDKTIEDDTFGEEFNVWVINRKLGENGWNNADAIIQEIRDRIEQARQRNNAAFRCHLEIDAADGDEDAQELLAQQDQIAAIQAAEATYKENGNIEAYTLFWENIWDGDGLLFRGSHWTFRLADLYIKQKRYDDALDNLSKITAEEYSDKKLKYIERIEKAQQKQQ